MSSTAKVTVGISVIVVIALVVIMRRPPAADQPVLAPDLAEAPVATAPAAPARDNSAELLDLKNRLAEERRARQNAEAEVAALREKAVLPPTNAASLVKVQDMGKRAGVFLPSMGDLAALTSREPNSLAPEEKRRLLELQRENARLLGALPEITRYQDNPEEYGRFFSSMFEQAAGLTEAQAAQVEAYMRERGTTMNQLRLNAANEPTDAKLEEEWEGRRDAFNEQTAHGLKTILPPGAAEKVNFGPELLEFLEMDFDKINVKPPERTVP